MDSIDDDFGELYADVEAQASSAIKSMYIELEYHYKDINITAGEKLLSSTDGHNQMTDESDSEDELNIVVNDDDCGKLTVTGARSHGGYEEEDGDITIEGTGLKKNQRPGDPVGDGLELNRNVLNRAKRRSGTMDVSHSQFKANVQQARPHGSANRRNMGISGSKSSCTISGREVGSSGHVANLYATASSLLPQYGYGFPHPWCRNILDVDFNSFEEKPWRYSGADITDFFNFGFNEDRWKRYCNLLENCWRQASMQTITLPDSLKLNQPQGRAIQVKDSISERQISMDLWSPRFQDSDVVIQIPLQDSILAPSGSVNGETGQSAHEVSKQGNLDAEDNEKFHTSHPAEDELHAVYLEEKVKTVASYASIRSLLPKTPSDLKSLDTDNAGNDKSLDDDGHCHGKMKVLTSEQTAEATETTKKGKEVVITNTRLSESCFVVKESSLGNSSHLSLSTSCFESDSDSQSNESVDGDSIKVQGPLISQPQDSGNELQDSGASDYKTSRRDGRKRKQDDDKPHSRCSCPSQDTQKHQSGECHGSGKEKIHLESGSNALPMSDEKGEKKTYPRNRSSDQKDSKNHSGRCSSLTKMDAENCKNTFPISQVYDKDCSSFACGRQKERPHNFGNYDREHCSNYRKRGPYCYNGERFAYNHFQAVHTKHPHLRAHHRPRDQSDQYARKNWNVSEYFNKRKTSTYIEDGMTRNSYRDSRGSLSGYSSTLKGRDNQWRKGNDRVKLRKITDHAGYLFDHKDEKEQQQNTYKRAFSFTDLERDLLVETYEKCLPVIEREVKVSARRFQHCDTAFHLNNSWSMETEDAYHRDAGSKSFFSKIHRGRWHHTLSPRNKLYGSRLSKQYSRHWKQTCHEEFGESDWYGGYNDVDDTEDDFISDDNQICPWERSYSRRSKGQHWTEDELILRHQDYQFPAENALFPYEETSKQDIIHGSPGSLQGRMFVDGLQMGHPRYKLMRERTKVSCLNRNSNSYRGEDVQMVQKCRGAVNLIVGEGKFSGRCTDGRSFARNFRVEKMGMKFLKEKTNLNHLKNSQSGKLVKTDIPNIEGNRNNDKLLQKLLVEEHSEDFDIEEGQIIEQEGNNGDNVEKKLVSDIATRICIVKKSRECIGNASSGNKDASEYDNQRILETMAKMEKRRERFKDPDSKKEEPENAPKVEVELVDDTSDAKLQRPARKRRWGS
ncbi:hypothetical protein SLE2022_164610 [Rubroshorea leprosula]